MPRHEVSVVNLQLGIKASKYLIHQPSLRTRGSYFICQKVARELDPSIPRFLSDDTFSEEREIPGNSGIEKARTERDLPFVFAIWVNVECRLVKIGDWASTGDTNTALHSKFNREDKLRRNPTSLSRSLCRDCWFTSSYAVRPTFEPASTLPAARFSHETRRCNLNILYARQTYFRKCVDSANCSTDIPQVARQTTLKLLRVDESKKLLLVDSIASDFCLKKSSQTCINSDGRAKSPISLKIYEILQFLRPINQQLITS